MNTNLECMNGNTLYSKNKCVSKKFLSTFFLGPKFGPPTLATSIFVIDLTVIGTQLTFNSFTLPFPFSLSLLNPFRKFSLEILEPVWPIKFGHLISITHHSIFHIRLPSSLSFHRSLLFTLFGGPTSVIVQLFFFFPAASSFFFFPSWVGCSVWVFFFFFTKFGESRY